MQALKNISIRRKQTLIMVLAASVALFLACASFSIYEVVSFKKDVVEEFSILAGIVGNNCAAALDFNEAKSANETLAALQADPDIIGACIYSADREMFAQYDRPNDNLIFSPPAHGKPGHTFERRRLTLASPIIRKGETIGVVYLESDMRDLYSRLTAYACIVGIIFVVALLAVLMLSGHLQKLVSDPILRLATVVRSVTVEKNYSLRATKESNDELGQLMEDFNEMLSQIQQRDGALESARENLERRVEERTAELSQSNTSLQAEMADRKQAEEMLRWKTALLEAQLNSTLDGILIVDQDGKMILQNRRFIDLMKMPPAIAQEQSDEKRLQWFFDNVKNPELVGQKISYLYAHPDEISNDEIEFKDGTILDRYSAPVAGHDGKCHGRIWIFHDITGRKQAEEQLRSAHSQLEQLLAHSPAVIYRLKVEGDKITPVMCSENITRFLGFTVAETMTYEWWFNHLHPEERDKALASLPETLKQGTSRCEFRMRHKDGSYRWVEDNRRRLCDAAGVPIEMIGVWTDITERKKFEAQSLQSQKMETVGKLAGGIAHEFNSILTAIIGQCELLLSDLPPGSRMAKSASEISQASGRAATLTQQLLAYGRKQMLQLETLDLNKVIVGMERVFKLLLGGDVAIQIVPSPDLRTVKADAGQIEQVIMNMAINAKDAMPNGGKFTLETANVSFDADSIGRLPELKPGDYVMLAISDTGAGMSEQVKARLFEPFFTTKGVGQGTGLGLSTCYGIIKQSGGHIGVYSEPGRGATFKIYLPQAEQPRKPPGEPAASPALARGTETILLVEDDPSLREMAGSLLTRLGYKVWPAANGVEALSLKQQRNVGHIDLLFTDVVMPHMSGKELADRVRSLYPLTRILFTTAYTENATVHQGALDKGVALLQKPYTPSALAKKLRELLDQPAS
jgi:PAS domain S-box-containing protein